MTQGQPQPMTLTASRDIDILLPLLREADEDEKLIADAISNAANTAYLAWRDDRPFGAVMVHWHEHESEITYIAVEKASRGKGYGKMIIAALLDEARQRQVKSILVGTANSSMDNISFYQKCGFRMDSIRKNFFSYKPAPIYENGIRVIDMIVFRYDLSSG